MTISSMLISTKLNEINAFDSKELLKIAPNLTHKEIIDMEFLILKELDFKVNYMNHGDFLNFLISFYSQS